MSAIVPRLLYGGENCIVVEFGSDVDLNVNAHVQALRKKIENNPFSGFVDTVPTYRSLAVCFDALKIKDFQTLEKHLLQLSEELDVNLSESGELLIVPVCYEGDFAPDIGRVAAHAGLPVDEVIRRHSANDCYCHMLGFVPGYSYLGGMDESLETPRLKEPREKIPAGSVGIAGKQTSIYPIESPAGWNIIGKTPLCMFDCKRTPAIFLSAGMWVRFKPISLDEFYRLSVDARSPDWRPEIVRRAES